MKWTIFKNNKLLNKQECFSHIQLIVLNNLLCTCHLVQLRVIPCLGVYQSRLPLVPGCQVVVCQDTVIDCNKNCASKSINFVLGMKIDFCTLGYMGLSCPQYCHPCLSHTSYLVWNLLICSIDQILVQIKYATVNLSSRRSIQPV